MLDNHKNEPEGILSIYGRYGHLWDRKSMIPDWARERRRVLVRGRSCDDFVSLLLLARFSIAPVVWNQEMKCHRYAEEFHAHYHLPNKRRSSTKFTCNSIMKKTKLTTHLCNRKGFHFARMTNMRTTAKINQWTTSKQKWIPFSQDSLRWIFLSLRKKQILHEKTSSRRNIHGREISQMSLMTQKIKSVTFSRKTRIDAQTTQCLVSWWTFSFDVFLWKAMRKVELTDRPSLLVYWFSHWWCVL
jgi:hypothetical protein